MSLWEAFVAFGETVVRVATQTATEDVHQTLTGIFQALTQSERQVTVEEALRTYFDQPPAHVTAVNSLDHTQFLHPLVVSGCPSLMLRDVLETFSRLGPAPYGEVWLSLLDVAERANPAQVRAADARQYIQAQMSHSNTTDASDPGAGLVLPSPAQLDGILTVCGCYMPTQPHCVHRFAASRLVSGVGCATAS